MIRPSRDSWGGVPEPAPVVPVPDVPLFLWCGQHRLGVLRRRDDLPPAVAAQTRSAGELHAVLVPDVALPIATLMRLLTSVVQHPRPFAPAGTLVHHPRPLSDMADAPAYRTGPDRSGDRAAPGPPREVGLEEAYSVRDAEATSLPFQKIHIREIRLVPGREAEALRSLPRTALIAGSVWTVTGFP